MVSLTLLVTLLVNSYWYYISLLEHDNKPINHKYVNFLLNKSLKKKADKIIVSITGCNISSNQSFKQNICYKHIDELDNYISIIKDGLIKRSFNIFLLWDLLCKYLVFNVFLPFG